MYVCVRLPTCERFMRAWRDKWQTGGDICEERATWERGVEVGFGGLWGTKWDRRVGRVRFNSDSDVSVGHVDWQAFGATVYPPFLFLLCRAACDKKRGRRGPRATWRADNAGEMCTGIIFPGKCGVIEKKNERARGGGATRRCMLPELSGLYFAGDERAGSKDGEGRRAHPGDSTWCCWMETRAMIEDPYARIRQVHKCYRWNSDQWRFNKVEMDGVVWLTRKFCRERRKELYSQQRKDLMYLLISIRNLLSLFYFRFSRVISLFLSLPRLLPLAKILKISRLQDVDED